MRASRPDPRWARGPRPGGWRSGPTRTSSPGFLRRGGFSCTLQLCRIWGRRGPGRSLRVSGWLSFVLFLSDPLVLHLLAQRLALPTPVPRFPWQLALVGFGLGRHSREAGGQVEGRGKHASSLCLAWGARPAICRSCLFHGPTCHSLHLLPGDPGSWALEALSSAVPLVQGWRWLSPSQADPVSPSPACLCCPSSFIAMSP